MTAAALPRASSTPISCYCRSSRRTWCQSPGPASSARRLKLRLSCRAAPEKEHIVYIPGHALRHLHRLHLLLIGGPRWDPCTCFPLGRRPLGPPPPPPLHAQRRPIERTLPVAQRFGANRRCWERSGRRATCSTWPGCGGRLGCVTPTPLLVLSAELAVLRPAHRISHRKVLPPRQAGWQPAQSARLSAREARVLGRHRHAAAAQGQQREAAAAEAAVECVLGWEPSRVPATALLNAASGLVS